MGPGVSKPPGCDPRNPACPPKVWGLRPRTPPLTMSVVLVNNKMIGPITEEVCLKEIVSKNS
jgi:hypothetical protein